MTWRVLLIVCLGWCSTYGQSQPQYVVDDTAMSGTRVQTLVDATAYGGSYAEVADGVQLTFSWARPSTVVQYEVWVHLADTGVDASWDSTDYDPSDVYLPVGSLFVSATTRGWVKTAAVVDVGTGAVSVNVEPSGAKGYVDAVGFSEVYVEPGSHGTELAALNSIDRRLESLSTLLAAGTLGVCFGCGMGSFWMVRQALKARNFA